jgi:HTH-type transcriptional regulator / antitoxin HipB
MSKLKIYTLDEVVTDVLGERGTMKREQFEHELQIEIIGSVIRQTRLERNLTQDELGRIVGVGKSQISKLEKNAGNVSIQTIKKIFDALKAKILFRVEIQAA